MPAQEPVASIISKSKVVRCSRRCASSSRPARLSSSRRAAQFLLDAGDGLDQRRPRRHVMRIGVDLDEVEFVGLGAGERVHLLDLLDLVAEQMHAPGAVLVVRRENVDGVAAHAERAAEEVALRALVLQRHQIGEQLALVDLAALLEGEGHGRIGFHRADAVDAGHRSDDDDVVAFQERARRRVAHAVDLLVDGAFFLDIGVGARNVGLRLVVVVIGDEIFDRVVGEERLELAVELRGQRLVRRQDKGRALRRLDHLRHGEGLTRAGDAKQHLGAVVAPHAFDQFLDRLRLVAFGLKVRRDLEALAAFGFFRPRRPVRRPRHGGEFGASLAQQSVERLLAGDAGNAARLRRQVGAGQAVFRKTATGALFTSPRLFFFTSPRRAGRGRRAQRVG